MRQLALRGVSKAFGALRALDGVDLDVRAGRIHALVGENGAGKSTLVRILTGSQVADSGTLAHDGGAPQPLRFSSPQAARRFGIGVVHQHDTLIDAFTIEENLELSRSRGATRRGSGGAFRESVALPERSRLARELSIGERQRVEIARALEFDPEVLILDEPTAVLAPGEADALLQELRALAERGVAIVFISHYLDEVLAIADDISVLRRGRIVATAGRGEIDRDRLAAAMVGESLGSHRHADVVRQSPRLEVTQLATDERVDPAVLRGITLVVHGGECVGLAGVAGNGQRALAAVLSGRMRPSAGSVTIAGQCVATPEREPHRSRDLAVVPEDRRSEGLALELSIAENLLLSERSLIRAQRGVLLSRRAARERARSAIEHFEIFGATAQTPVGSLSGGNQQRVILARELDGDPAVVLLVQPTRGLDVKACAYVHRMIERVRERGGAVLLISTDLDEIRSVSDRILVMSRGRLVAELPRGASDSEIGRALGGGSE